MRWRKPSAWESVNTEAFSGSGILCWPLLGLPMFWELANIKPRPFKLHAARSIPVFVVKTWQALCPLARLHFFLSRQKWELWQTVTGLYGTVWDWRAFIKKSHNIYGRLSNLGFSWPLGKLCPSLIHLPPLSKLVRATQPAVVAEVAKPCFARYPETLQLCGWVWKLWETWLPPQGLLNNLISAGLAVWIEPPCSNPFHTTSKSIQKKDEYDII